MQVGKADKYSSPRSSTGDGFVTRERLCFLDETLQHIFMLVGKVDPMWGIHTAANLDVGKKEWNPVHK